MIYLLQKCKTYLFINALNYFCNAFWCALHTHMSWYCTTQLTVYIFVVTWLYSDDLHWIESARVLNAMRSTHSTFDINW